MKKLNKQNDIPWRWIGKFNIVNMLIFPKLIFRFNALQAKPQQVFVSFFMKKQRVKNIKVNLEKEQNQRNFTTRYQNLIRKCDIATNIGK